MFEAVAAAAFEEINETRGEHAAVCEAELTQKFGVFAVVGGAEEDCVTGECVAKMIDYGVDCAGRKSGPGVGGPEVAIDDEDVFEFEKSQGDAEEFEQICEDGGDGF